MTGVDVDGTTLDADGVICATGRGSKLGDDVRAPGAGSACGFSYVARTYQARPDAPWPTWALSGSVYDGYRAMLFPHDNRTLSALIVLPTHDTELTQLRHADAFDQAAPLISQLAPWTNPEQFQPLTDPMTGGRLTNEYRGQLDESGHAGMPGVYFVGDAVCTTNSAAGRGVALGFQQAQALLATLGESDMRDTSQQLDAWCQDNIQPWYEDHVLWDAEVLRRYAGADIDPEGPSVPISSAPPRRPTRRFSPPPAPS